MALPRQPWQWVSDLAAVAVLLAVAVAPRFYGLTWGLPDAVHSYSYHPDEFLLIGSALVVLQSGIPAFYNYPSLYIYAAALALLVGLGYGGVSSPADTYLAARVVTAAAGVGAVAAVCWAGRAAYGRATGIAAGVILAIVPLHVQHSHFATVDVPSTLPVAAALGFAGLIIHRGAWSDYLLAGAMSGLAAGTKYNAGLVLLAPLAAHFLRERSRQADARLSRPVATVACSAAAFVISTPGVILRWSQFAHGLGYELQHSADGHGLVFASTGNGFVHTFASSLWHGLGPGLAVVFGVAAVYAVIRRERVGLAVLAFIVPYLILISLSQVRFARYTLPLFPAAAMLCGYLLIDAWVRIRGRTARAALAALAAAAFVCTLTLTLALALQFGGSDPRDSAARWIGGRVSPGSEIGVMEVPWFYSPPLSRNLGFGTLAQREQAAAQTPYGMIVFSRCAEPGCWWSEEEHPRWVVLSSFEVRDVQRLADARGLADAQAEQVRRALRDLEIVRDNYRLRARFGRPSRLPLLWSLPHDMQYVRPEILIYEAKQ